MKFKLIKKEHFSSLKRFFCFLTQVVIPVKTGIQERGNKTWIPASAGMARLSNKWTLPFFKGLN